MKPYYRIETQPYLLLQNERSLIGKQPYLLLQTTTHESVIEAIVQSTGDHSVHCIGETDGNTTQN